MTRRFSVVLVSLSVAGFVPAASGQDDATAPTPAAAVIEPVSEDPESLTPPTPREVEADPPGVDEGASQRPTSSDVLDDLMRERDPLLEPLVPPSPATVDAPRSTPIPPTTVDVPATRPREGDGSIPSRINMPAPSVDLDPAILGVAPDAARPKLRREGDLVVQRRGRLLRSSDGEHVMLVFDAAGAESDEPPMILMPSRLLEEMEDLVQNRGDQTVFVVSGQVHAYRGANYLLPTMMEVARGGDNLRR